MATHDVPGANPANRDLLHDRCWAEHTDGSLVLVEGVEGDKVIYQMFDTKNRFRFMDATPTDAFKKLFSVPHTGVSKVEWTWHDKTTFPWDRVMSVFQRPIPEPMDAEQQLTAAQQVAERLKLHAERLTEDMVRARTDEPARKGAAVLDKIADALTSVVESLRSHR